jgi:hypothetical protein
VSKANNLLGTSRGQWDNKPVRSEAEIRADLRKQLEAIHARYRAWSKDTVDAVRK